MLQAMAGNPKLANPIINPLSFGMILQGPSFINFATPNAPVKTEVAKVATNCQSYGVYAGSQYFSPFS